MQNFQTSMQNGLVIGEAIGRGLAARRQKKRNNALATSFQEGGLEALGNTAAEQGNLQLAMQARQAWEQSRQAADQNVRDAMADFEGYAARIVQNADDPETAQAAMVAMGMQVAQRHNIPTEEFMQSAPIYTNYDIAKVVFSDADAEVARDNIRSQINDREQDNRRADERAAFDRERFAYERDQDAAAVEAEQVERVQEAADPTTVATLQTMLANIDRLAPGGDLNNGLRASFGFRKGLTGPITLAGTDKAAAQALVEQVVGGLTLEQAESLKGVLSDKDMLLLERSASVLGNRGISDTEAERALQEIRELFTIRLQQAGGASPEQAAPQSTGYELPDGQVLPEGQTIQQNGRTFIVRNGQVVPQ